MSGISDASQVNGPCLGLTALSPTILAVLLIISGTTKSGTDGGSGDHYPSLMYRMWPKTQDGNTM